MPEVVVLGIDIGGANIKAVKIVKQFGKISVEDIVREYLPLWIKGVEGLKEGLSKLKHRFRLGNRGYFVGVCMTAELSDIFSTKDEGVSKVVDVVEEVFSDAIGRLYVNFNVDLVRADEAKANPITIAAANWAASAWLLERIACKVGVDSFVFVDIGSTTTTIIPIVEGKTKVRGRTDPEKLLYGELVYVGTLRTDVTSLVNKVPYKGFYVDVCRERFSLVGDVHLLLGYIRAEDYSTETADGRGKSIEEAITRLSRIVCADKSMVTLVEAKEIARYIYENQVFKVFQALVQVRSWLASLNVNLDNFAVVVAGIGKHIAIEAAKRAGFANYIDIDHILGKPLSGVVPAYASALMVLNKLGKYDASCP